MGDLGNDRACGDRHCLDLGKEMTRAIDLELGDVLDTAHGPTIVTGIAISDESVGVLVMHRKHGRLQYKHHGYETRFRHIGSEPHDHAIKVVQQKLAKGRKADD